MLEKLTSFSLAQLIRNRSVQNFGFFVSIQGSNVIISLLTIPLLVQALGVEQFGLVNLALAVIIVSNIIVGFGYNLSGPREVALQRENSKSLSDILSTILFGKTLVAILVSMGLIISVVFLGLFKEYGIILLYSLILVFYEATLPLWFYQGLERMKLIAVANVIGKLLYLTGLVLFIHSPEQAKWVNFLLGSTSVFMNILLLGYLQIGMKVRIYLPKTKAIFQSLKSNGLLFLSNLVAHFSVNGGLIILSFFASAGVLGMFSLAERVSMVLRLFPSLLIQAVFPQATKLSQVGVQALSKFLRKVSLIAIFGSLLISVSVWLLAPWIIEVLSREDLPESITFLRILAFVPFLASLNISNVLMFLVKDQKNLFFQTSSWMFGFMVLVCTGLTYLYGGAGLCWGLLATEFFVFIVSAVINAKKNPDEVKALLTPAK